MKLFKKIKTKTAIVITIICLSVVSVGALILNVTVFNDNQIIEDNGYYEGTGKFDKEMTPVTNMLIILKVLNGSNLCDNDWYKEVRECQKLLKKQAVENKKSKDPYVQKMMEMQLQIVDDLHAISSNGLGKKAKTEDIDRLQKSFDAYSEYYYQNYDGVEVI